MAKNINKCRKSSRLSNKTATPNPQLKNLRNRKPLYYLTTSPQKCRPKRNCHSKNLRERVNKPDFYKEDDDTSSIQADDVFKFESDYESSSSDDSFMSKIKKYTKTKSTRARRDRHESTSEDEVNKNNEHKHNTRLQTRVSTNRRSERNKLQNSNGITILNQKTDDFDVLTDKKKSKIPDSSIQVVLENIDINKNNSNVSDIIIDDDMSDGIPDNSAQITSIDKEFAKTEIENLTKSFLEETPRVQIISNVVLRKAGDTSPTEVPIRAKPWRWDIPCKKIYGFTYKDKSFTPRYEPNYNYKLVEIENKPEQKKSKRLQQTSIKNFLNGENHNIIKPTQELFADVPRSPRKALCEINIIQSTPIKPGRIDISHDISAILNSPKKKLISSQKENLIMKSPTKKKPKSQSINLTDNTSVEDITVPLFDELDEELTVSKSSTSKYVKKYQKRKRQPSIREMNDTDSEVDVVTVDKPEKKKKNVRTKKEEQEATRLAKFYNSMFEEIQKYPLIIE